METLHGENKNMSIANSWDRIVAWHNANVMPGMFKLHDGASSTSIDAFEKAIGVAVPKDFRESYLLHDGGDCSILWHADFLTLRQIAKQWNEYRELQNRGQFATDDWLPRKLTGPVKKIFWNTKRIPITDNSGDHLMLDLDPPDNGIHGQILEHSHEIGPENVLAPNWETFLANLATDLERGKYIYVEDEETVALPGMYD